MRSNAFEIVKPVGSLGSIVLNAKYCRGGGSPRESCRVAQYRSGKEVRADLGLTGRDDLFVGRKPAGLFFGKLQIAVDGNFEHAGDSGHQLDFGTVFRF